MDSEKVATGASVLSLAVAWHSVEWLPALRCAFCPLQRLNLGELGVGGRFQATICIYVLALGESALPNPSVCKRLQCLPAPLGTSEEDS